MLPELRGQKGCSSYWGCDLCFARAERFAEDQGEGDTGAGGKKKDKRKRAKGFTMVYRAGGTAPLRTHDRHMELSQRIGPDSEEYPGEYFGVKEGPLFLTEILPDFDIVRDICIDWMHNVCEGTCRSGFMEINSLVDRVNYVCSANNFPTLIFAGFIKKAYCLTFAQGGMGNRVVDFSDRYQRIKVPRDDTCVTSSVILLISKIHIAVSHNCPIMLGTSHVYLPPPANSQEELECSLLLPTSKPASGAQLRSSALSC